MVALEPLKQDLIVVDGLGWQFGDGPGVDHMRIAMMWNGSPMLTGQRLLEQHRHAALRLGQLDLDRSAHRQQAVPRR